MASDALRRFQLTPLRTAVAVAVVVVLAFITVASIALAFTAVAFTVVQPYPYAVGWPASELPRSVLLLTAHTALPAAVTIPIQPATRTGAEPRSRQGRGAGKQQPDRPLSDLNSEAAFGRLCSGSLIWIQRGLAVYDQLSASPGAPSLA